MNHSIPTYVISLAERTDRQENIKKQFAGRQEFDWHFFPAIKCNRGAEGLWHSIVEIVRMAQQNNNDKIIICEDDHIFTSDYNSETLFKNIYDAADKGCQILLGGIGNFNNLVPIQKGLYWVDIFWCTQFMVVYKSAYDYILNADFIPDESVADEFLSQIIPYKMVVSPFISIQRDFGYSDVTISNTNNHGLIEKLFKDAARRMELYNRICTKYCIFPQAKEQQEESKQYPSPYIKQPKEFKLHIGCGTCLKEDWLNVDINPIKGAEYMDAGKRFPFESNTFTYIYSEHLIEHLNYDEGKNMISESFRVLKPNGTFRLSMPNFEFLIDLYTHPEKAQNRHYLQWSAAHYAGWLIEDFGITKIPTVLIINNFMRKWGHQVVYDKNTMENMLAQVGFSNIHTCKIGQSNIPSLMNIEEHGSIIPKWANEMETIIIEAKK